MDIRNRIIGPCSTVNPETEEVAVDISTLALRLILCDLYILKSNRFLEMPHFIRAFGFDGTLALINSGAIKIHCDAMTVGQTGQTKIETRLRRGILPLGSYSFQIIRIANRKQYIHECMESLNQIPGLHFKQTRKMKKAIADRLVAPPKDDCKETISQLKADLQNNVPNIAIATSIALKEKVYKEILPSDFSIRVHPIDGEDFQVVTDIADRFALDEQETHTVVERALLSLGGLNQRIEYMKEYSAMSGFRDEDLPVFEQKLNFLAQQMSYEAQEDRFRRIISITGLPNLEGLVGKEQIDIQKLLEIRDTKECKEFRAWLWTIDNVSDDEINEHFGSLKEKLSSFAHGKMGKSIKWMVTTGIGAIPVAGAIAGPVASLLDTFLLEKVLPNPGAISFLSKLYPSIFKKCPGD